MSLPTPKSRIAPLLSRLHQQHPDARYELESSRTAVKTGPGWQPDVWRALRASMRSVLERTTLGL